MRALLVLLSLLVASIALAPSAAAEEQDCVGKPTIAVACVTTGDERNCVGVGFGYQGVGACLYDDGFGYCVGLVCDRYVIR